MHEDKCMVSAILRKSQIAKLRFESMELSVKKLLSPYEYFICTV